MGLDVTPGTWERKMHEEADVVVQDVSSTMAYGQWHETEISQKILKTDLGKTKFNDILGASRD